MRHLVFSDPLPNKNWELHRLGALAKLGIKSESTPGSYKPFHIGFVLSEVIFYEWMQILRFVQLPIGEFLAGGLVWAACCRSAVGARIYTRQLIFLYMDGTMA